MVLVLEDVWFVIETLDVDVALIFEVVVSLFVVLVVGGGVVASWVTFVEVVAFMVVE